MALKPYTLAEVSGAVPQTPICYVHREEETTRWGGGSGGRGCVVVALVAGVVGGVL